MGRKRSGDRFNSMNMKFLKINNIFVLRKKNTRRLMFNLDARKVRKIPQVLHSELVRKGEIKNLKKLRRASTQNTIIHIKKKDQM